MINPKHIEVSKGSSIPSPDADRPSVHVTNAHHLLRTGVGQFTRSSYVSVVGHPSKPAVVDPVFRTRVLPGRLGSAATDMVVGAKTGVMRLIVALRS